MAAPEPPFADAVESYLFRLSGWLGVSARTAFLMTLTESGGIKCVCTEPPPGRQWPELVDDVRRDDVPHIFYEPDVFPGDLSWKTWHRVPQPVMERLIRRGAELPSRRNPTADLEPLAEWDGYPTSWADAW